MNIEDTVIRARSELEKATKAESCKKFMQEYFDQMSEEIFAEFMNADVNDSDSHRALIMLHKSIASPQLWLDTIIDSGKLAQITIDKYNGDNK